MSQMLSTSKSRRVIFERMGRLLSQATSNCSPIFQANCCKAKVQINSVHVKGTAASTQFPAADFPLAL